MVLYKSNNQLIKVDILKTFINSLHLIGTNSLIMLMIAQVSVFQGEGLNENFETKMATLVFLVGKFWFDCDC